VSEQASADTSAAPAPTVQPPKRGRYPQTALALVGAIIGCLAIVAFLILVVVRPDGGSRPASDWHAVAEQVAAEYGAIVIDPQLPEGWSANYARLTRGEEADTWEIGFLSPAEGYVGFVQYLGEPGAALPDTLGESAGTWQVGGRVWEVFDQRALDPTGNDAFAIVADLSSSTVLLHGSAGDDDFLVIADAVAEASR